MSNKIMKPLSLAVGVAFVGSLAIAQAATASSFSLVDMDAGYQLAGEGHDHDHADKAKKEGSCGEGKCGEGKCGVAKLDTDKDGGVSSAEFVASGHTAEKFATVDTDKNGSLSQAEFDAAHAAHKAKEGSCGEGKCGADKAKAEGDKAKEGACGADKGKEGSCGGSL